MLYRTLAFGLLLRALLTGSAWAEDTWAAVLGMLALACGVLAVGGDTQASTQVSTSPSTAAVSAVANPLLDSVVDRGRYLTVITGCHDCHTPFHMTEEGPAPDMSRMFMGHPQDMDMPPAPVLPACAPWAHGSTREGGTLTDFLPRATAGRLLGDVIDNGRLSVAFSRIRDHRTV